MCTKYCNTKGTNGKPNTSVKTLPVIYTGQFINCQTEKLLIYHYEPAVLHYVLYTPV